MVPVPMMGFMMVVALVVAVLLLVLILGVVRNTDAKAKHTDLEKPKRQRLTLGDDGELVASDEDELPPLYNYEERQ